jgi:hypothetical protein
MAGIKFSKYNIKIIIMITILKQRNLILEMVKKLEESMVQLV